MKQISSIEHSQTLIDTTIVPDRNVKNENVSSHQSAGRIIWENLTPKIWTPFDSRIEYCTKNEILGFQYQRILQDDNQISMLMNGTILDCLSKQSYLIPNEYKMLSMEYRWGINICFFGTIYTDARGKYIRYIWIENKKFKKTFCRYLDSTFDRSYVVAVTYR